MLVAAIQNKILNKKFWFTKSYNTSLNADVSINLQSRSFWMQISADLSGISFACKIRGN